MVLLGLKTLHGRNLLASEVYDPDTMPALRWRLGGKFQLERSQNPKCSIQISIFAMAALKKVKAYDTKPPYLKQDLRRLFSGT